MGFDVLYALGLNYLHRAAIVLPDVVFVLGILNQATVAVPAPSGQGWLLALARVQTHGEHSSPNILRTLVACFTECQLWIPFVRYGFQADQVARRPQEWVKIERFAVAPRAPR